MEQSALGICATCYLSVWETIDTLTFLERCHRFGAAGIQAVIQGDPIAIRTRAEQLGMYVEAMVALPVDGDQAAFEVSLQVAQSAGASALRAACLGTRRYETFHQLDDWANHVAASNRSLALALPILDRYKIPLGLENHKDWTSDELTALVRQYSSEYFGVCLDFGNNIALLDEPMDAIEKLAPYAVTTHVKDVAVAPYEEGILLSEVVLGQGILDLPQAIRLIQSARPATRMTLEMITRDPLRIPLLTEKYRATFPSKSALDVASVMLFVNQQAQALPRVSHLNEAAIAELEHQNIAQCLAAWPKL